jgi:hypothetical protein
MITLLLLAAAYGVYRGARAALESLHSLPQRNEDMVFY